MCRPTPANTNMSSARKDPACRLTPPTNTTTMTEKYCPSDVNKPIRFSFPPKLWPLPLWLIVAAFPLLPTWCYLNRGYTVWFHWCSIAFLLTQNKTLGRFVAVQGLLVCAGWYSSLVFDYMWNDRCMHMLYRNVPAAIGQYILDGDNITGQDIFVLPSTTLPCILGQLLAWSLDLLAHAGMAYCFWKYSYKSLSLPCCSWNDIISWKILGAALMLSRLWSITHNYLHSEDQQILQLFYFGTEVYKLSPDSEQLWMAAYTGETLMAVGIVVGKLWISSRNQQQKAM